MKSNLMLCTVIAGMVVWCALTLTCACLGIKIAAGRYPEALDKAQMLKDTFTFS